MAGTLRMTEAAGTLSLSKGRTRRALFIWRTPQPSPHERITRPRGSRPGEALHQRDFTNRS
jgi:hypothetical protein